MSLKGTAMTEKVLRGKIKDIHQIEDVEALFAEAEELLDKAESFTAKADAAEKKCDEALNAIDEAKKEMLSDIEIAADIVQSPGTSNTAIMSQNAVSEMVANHYIEKEVVELETKKGFYKIDGSFVDDSERLCASVPVSKGEVYLLTTAIRSAIIAGIIFLDGTNNVVSYELLGTGTQEIFTDYRVTIPDGVSVMVVQNAVISNPLSLTKAIDKFSLKSYTKDEVDERFDFELNRIKKKTYNQFDKYNADIKPYYVRISDGEVIEANYARTIILKKTVSIGDVVQVNNFAGYSNLGIKDLSIFVFPDYPTVGEYGNLTDIHHINFNYCQGRATVTAEGEYIAICFSWDTNVIPDEPMKQLIEKLVVVCGSSVGDYAEYPYIENEIVKVERENLSPDILENLQESSSTLNYVETKTVYLGDNVLGSAGLGEGWTENAGLFTHTAGSTADLTFATSAEEGSVYILEFDTSYTEDEFVRVGLGNMYRVLCYNGGNRITVPLLASGGNTLYITPINGNYAGSINNITLRKIQENGTEYTLELYSTTTNNHTKNYGFWNNFIGKQTAENAVGSTRCIAIGYCTLNALQGGHRNIGIGTFAMSQMYGGEENISIGSDSMLGVKTAVGCVVAGFGAMYNGTSRKEDIAIGKNALVGAVDAETIRNIAIGNAAGYKVKTAKENIFLGNNSGYNAISAFCNTIVGNDAGKSLTTGYFNTVIGREANLPAGATNVVVIGNNAQATKSNQAVIGDDNIAETILKGNLIVRATDGTKKQIVFNDNGTIGWVSIN